MRKPFTCGAGAVFFAGVVLFSLPILRAQTAASPAPEHTNRLIHEKSPYLLEHAHNPVDWYPWGEEAFAKAHRENKPIFLSVGYSTCHWCHVLERESFENPAIAKLMNDSFVSIKGGPRGAPRRRHYLHDLHPGDDRRGRLAHDCLPHPGTQALYRRHLLSRRR